MSRRFALIIGNSTYDDQTLAKLKTPEADVQTLAGALRDAQLGGFDDVQEMVNQPESAVRRAISSFYLQKKSDDLLLLYFSGHGVLDAQGRLFLAVKDTQRELLNATAIPASFIADDMDACRSKRQILILDCCHSGAFARGSKGDAPAVTQTTFEGNGFGRVVLTASDSTQYALEGDQVIQQASLSLFTHYLLEGLTTGQADSAQDGWITLDEWYDYAYDRVVSETPEQTPRKWVYNQQGELVISRNPNPVSLEPADLPAELKLAVESPFVGVRADAVEELKRLLRGSTPALSQAAFESLQNLASHDDSRRIASAAEEALAGFTPAQKAIVVEPAPTETGLPPIRPEEIQAALAEKAKIEAERVAAEKAEFERLAREKAEAERLAAKKAAEGLPPSRQEAERIAAEQAAERLAAEKAESERLAREKAEAERAESARVAREKVEAERLAQEKVEAERIARLEAEQAAAKTEAERLAREKDEAERLAAEKAAEGLPPSRQEAERLRAEQFSRGQAGFAFIGELSPKKFKAGETAELAVRTTSPVPATFSVDFSDAREALNFTPPRVELTVQPGQTATIRFRAAPRQRPLIAYHTYPINARITSASGEVQNLPGTVTARPLAPAWLLIPGAVLIIFCLFVYGIYQWLIAPGINQGIADDHATTTALAAIALLGTETPTPTSPTNAIPTTPAVFASPTIGIILPVITPTAPPQEAPSPTPPRPSVPFTERPSLAFASNRDGNWEIYIMALDGMGLTRLTNDPHDDSFPVFSPDGKKILFHSDRMGNFDIYVMNTDGSQLTQLTTDSRADTYASWSPDGREIVFQTKRDGAKEIYVMNADGSNQTRLTHNEVDDQFPAWSPDGQWIIYSTQINDRLLQLSIMHPNGAGQHQLDVGAYADISFSFPVWSPDGTHIAAANTYSDNRQEIFVGVFTNDRIEAEYTMGGSATTTFTLPRWSSDGKLIYYVSNQNGNDDIAYMNADGRDGGWMTSDPSDEEAPSEASNALVPLTVDG